MRVGGSGYYNALYKYHIMYAIDALLSFRVGRAAQCSSIIPALIDQEHVLLFHVE